MAGRLSIEEIRSLSGDTDAHFLDDAIRASVYVRTENGQSVYEPLRIARVLFVGGLFLIETKDEPDDWYMGQSAKDGTIHCWGKYGTLVDAIRGL